VVEHTLAADREKKDIDIVELLFCCLAGGRVLSAPKKQRFIPSSEIL
jgi:hypothetical protein